MKKAKLFIVLIVAAVLAIPVTVIAATSDTPAAKTFRGLFGINTSKLTDQQKAEASQFSRNLADLQESFINQMVADGVMTKEQGDAAINRIEQALKNSQNNGYIYGMNGLGMPFGPGKRGAPAKSSIDISKLTDQQKTEIMATIKKIADLQKGLTASLVKDGLLTSDQADKINKKIDSLYGSNQDDIIPYAVMMDRNGFPGFGFFGIKGFDASKLTDQQKSDLDNYSSSVSDLQKELINELVADGVMTSEQGDAAINRIENGPARQGNNIQQGKGFPGGMGMNGGRFNRRTNPNNSGTAGDDKSAV